MRSFIFTMGLPAAGKTTVASTRYAETHTFIDPDAIKTEHPDYVPERAFETHEWSMQQAERRFMEACLSGEGDYLLDGTGCNAESLVRRMDIAKQWGFEVTLFYVKCTLETSLRRETYRERRVPEYVIREKARVISTSFSLCAPFAHHVVVVNNDADTF